MRDETVELIQTSFDEPELFPIKWDHLIDKKMRRNKEIERVIGIRSRPLAGCVNDILTIAV